MAESIVKVPSTASGDFDFLAFSFNGKHSYDDFGIYRTSGGDRYEEKLVPNMNDKTAEVPNGDGMYYFNTTYKQREFPISFAFEHLTEEQLRSMRRWLSGKELGDLWFEEAPYKVYTAKVTGQPSIKVIPFDETYTEGSVQKTRRIYKGEGSVTFTAYWPYAHTPDSIEYYSNKITEASGGAVYLTQPFNQPGGIITVLQQDLNKKWAASGSQNWCFSIDDCEQDIRPGEDGRMTTDFLLTKTHGKFESIYLKIPNEDLGIMARIVEIDFSGKKQQGYCGFTNSNEFIPASGLTNNPQTGDNPGDISAPFVLSKSGAISANTEFKVGNLSIKLLIDTYNLEWDSKTGIVSGTATSSTTSTRNAIPFTGNSCGGIPVGGLDEDEMTLNGATLKYHYWYY